MNLQLRLLTAFSFIGLLVLFVGLVGWVSTSKLTQHIQILTTNNVPNLDAIGKINEGQTRIENLQRILLNPEISAAQRNTTLVEIKKTWKRINEGFQQYDNYFQNNKKDKELYTQLKNEWNVWQRSHERFMQWEADLYQFGFRDPERKELELIIQGKVNSPEMAEVKKAIKLHRQLNAYSITEGNELFLASDQTIFNLIKNNQDFAFLVRKEAEEDVKNSMIFISLGVALCTIITIVLGMMISRQITNRVVKVVGFAEEIATGNLNVKITADSHNQDEINQLLISFQNMILNLNNFMLQIQQSGIQVTSSATQIAASGKQLETSITEQLASTNQVTVAAKEISATSRELVKTVEEVSALSQGTTVAASDSQKDLLQMETTMKQLVEATNSIAGRLGVISEKANNINNIVVTITKVADQTNLLSLNAAIEAEKAGEYGLGFAVVAREIRRLADQTAVATIDIEQMVKQMQSSVSTGVMEMDKFAAEVGRSVEDVRNISTQLGEIIEQVQDLTPRYEAVSQGMEAQSQGAIQISDAMSQLSSNSVQTAASLREINQAISQLNQVAQGLRQEMSRFKVNDNR
ncbi:methyl-accepting chemotaxis protein [Anabaena azotica]|uniref:methyl-accepting chemotaxis protein n=1 Tax=Anabaena azotica TaxID=197653 RepID=UPI0039A6A02F